MTAPPLQQAQPQPLQQPQASAPAEGAALPPIHFTQVANPTPNVVPVPVPNHPPYAQMITEAITALKDRNGSSKRAIAKYIERVYSNSNLPSTHSALLTHHLKRLKDQGSVVMVKHSYKLARSPVAPPPVNANGPKRRPGRPPKAKTGLTSPPAQPGQAVQAAPGVGSDGPFTVPVSVPVTGPVPATESIFASLGLVDAPVPVPVSEGPVPVPAVKKKPGRPRKVASGGVGVGLQPIPTLAKKSTGRPRKVAAKNAAPPGTGVFPVSQATQPISQPLGQPVSQQINQPKLKKDGTPMKPRGRPPRKNVQVLVQNPAPLSVAPSASATLVPNVYVGEGVLAAAPAPAAKRRGRPPRTQNGPKTPRKLSGKPLGRPKKISSSAGVQGPSMQQLLAFNEMRSKLDFFQLRIKQTIGVLKPALDSSTSATALGALRELEELANLELGPPATVQGQQPPPQNQA